MNSNVEYAKEALQVVLKIASGMLSSGAEIERVEDSVERMCQSFGAAKTEVFAVTYMILVTISGDGYDGITQIKRVKSFDRNMQRLSELNALSRRICEEKMAPEEANAIYGKIEGKRLYGLPKRMFIYALISAAFSIFFGGNVYDFILAGVVGALAAPCDVLLGKMELNRFFHIFLCAIYCGILANIGGYIWDVITPELVSIGNIMIFIPGVIFTCSLQELFAGNMLSGLTRFAEAAMISLVIATGFALVNVLL